MIAPALTLLLLAAEPVLDLSPEPNDQVVGGAMAPAALPAGTLAFWGLLGAPDVGVGYRQGFSGFEFNAQATFNYLAISTTLEVGGRVALYRKNRLELAPLAALGLEFNSGSTYFDVANFASIALRPRIGGIASYAFSETVQGLLLADVPWAISLNVVGTHFSPTLGAGAEFRLGGKLTVLALAQIGVDALKEPLGVTQVRPAWAIRLGFGYRVF